MGRAGRMGVPFSCLLGPVRYIAIRVANTWHPRGKGAHDAPSQRHQACALPHSVSPLRVRKRVSFIFPCPPNNDTVIAAQIKKFCESCGRTAAQYVEGRITRGHATATPRRGTGAGVAPAARP